MADRFKTNDCILHLNTRLKVPLKYGAYVKNHTQIWHEKVSPNKQVQCISYKSTDLVLNI